MRACRFRGIGFFSAILVPALLALPAPAPASPVDSPTARSAALAFLQIVHPPAPAIAACAEIPGGPLGYVFSLKPAGYVVVAGDDELPPVIAYSLESDYPDEAPPENPLLRLLTVDLARRLAAFAWVDPETAAAWRESAGRAWACLSSGASSTAPAPAGSPSPRWRFEQWPPEGSTPTGGWILTNWTQSAPYNALCPLDLAHGGARSLAGCPAVAMAQILNYHATIQHTAFGSGDRYWHAYAGNYYWIPDAAAQYGFPDFPTLNGYLAALTLHWQQQTPLTNTDKAALVFGCGVAAQQVYSASGSGTFGVDQAYAAYQRFAFTDSRLVHDTDPALYTDLAADMQIARPAHLAVVDPGWTMGHNLVVDGWNTDNYFHLNFGWGGSYNGWYLLPEGIPYGLTVIEGVILNISPSTESVGGTVPAACLEMAAGPNPFRGELSIGFDAPQAGAASLAIYDVSGRLTTVLLNEEVGPGPHSIRWSPAFLPAGAYVARLQTAGRVETTRVLYLK
jgi:hypothetical protein